jgi:hypothetical protein
MVFYVCAICGVEEGLRELTDVELVRHRIAMSGIEDKFVEMFKIVDDRPPNRHIHSIIQLFLYSFEMLLRYTFLNLGKHLIQTDVPN